MTDGPPTSRHRHRRPSRWKIRKAVKAVNGVLGSLVLEKHPDKTFIGRIERGFDFLGYHFGPEGLTLATKTVEYFVARAIRLYEREPGEASRLLPVWIGRAAPDQVVGG